LVLAKKNNPAATINKLVEVCFKDVHLSSMCYEKLKAKDPNLIDLIYSMLIYCSFKEEFNSIFIFLFSI